MEQGRGQQYNEDHSDAEDIQNEQQQAGMFSLMQTLVGVVQQ